MQGENYRKGKPPSPSSPAGGVTGTLASKKLLNSIN